MPSLTTHYGFLLSFINSVIDEDAWGDNLNRNWVVVDNLFYQLYQGIATLSGTYSLEGDITFSGETKVKDVALVIEDTASSEGNLLFDTNEDTAGEMLGKIDFQGHDDASNDAIYASIKAKITDATNTSEDGSVVINTTQDGSPVDELIIEKGTYTQGATGGAKGQGTINAKKLFIQGEEVNSVPTGTIIMFGSETNPAGYAHCGGGLISRTTYADLFAVIGTTWGAGDGSTTFKLPDLRGVFPRGWDAGRGQDPGRAFATYQGDGFKSHNHTGQIVRGTSTGSSAVDTAGSNASPLNFTTSSVGGNETRPKNVSVNFFIKY